MPLDKNKSAIPGAPESLEMKIADAPKSAAMVKPVMPDTISKADLEAHSEKYPICENHTQYALFPVGLSPMAFFDLYLSTNGQHQLSKFYESRNEENIQPGEWIVIENDEDRKDMQGIEIPGAI